MSKLKLLGLALVAMFALFGCNSDELESLGGDTSFYNK